MGVEKTRKIWKEKKWSQKWVRQWSYILNFCRIFTQRILSAGLRGLKKIKNYQSIIFPNVILKNKQLFDLSNYF